MEIRLSGGEIARIDEADEYLVSGFRWRVCYRVAGNERFVASVTAKRFSETVLMHRLLMQACAGVEVDHIDGNPLNNSRSNLRLCTHAENMRNRRMHRNNRTGLKGVYPAEGRWRAQIRVDGRKVNLGYFDSPINAHLAYAAASEKYHGKFGAVA